MEGAPATEETAPQAVGGHSSVVDVGDHKDSKRAESLVDKLIALHADRKSKLDKASIIRKTMQGLKGHNPQLQNTLKELIETCNDAKRIHESLSSLLPGDERKKHETWFKAKMIANNDVISETKGFVARGSVYNNGALSTVSPEMFDVGLNLSRHGELNANVGFQAVYDNGKGGDGVNQNDSVSNISSKRSRKTVSSGSSSTSSARIEAEAERAALVARAAALKEKHALEEQEQQLRRRREQLDVDTELAASAARLSVLQAADQKGGSAASSNGMNSYMERENRNVQPGSSVNATKIKFQPRFSKLTQGTSAIGPWPPNNPLSPEVLKGQTELWRRDAAEHQYNPCELQQGTLDPAEYSQQAKPLQQHEQQRLFSDQAANGAHSPDLLAIMQRQNDITATLVRQHHISSLPPREIPVFEGDPLQFKPFTRAFEQGVENKAGSADCLYYLEQFTRGQPQELVQSCQHMAPDHGYQVAKGLLQEHFGNPYKVASACMKKALAWQVVKAEDLRALQDYSLFLCGCCNVMGELHYVQELDMPVNMRTIISKLPYRMREQWRTTAHDIMERSHDRAHINDLVQFIEHRVKILSDPLYIQDPHTASAPRPPSRFYSQPRSYVRGNIVAAAVAEELFEHAKGQPLGTEHTEDVKCLWCDRCHLLEECTQFTSKMHKEKILFLRQRGLCFACLRTGHLSRDCEGRLACKTCGQSHPTVLHLKGQVTQEQLTVAPAQQQSSPQTCGHTGAGKDHNVLSILPVKVKSAKGSHVITTYAFLDPGSSATFCSERLMRKLNITGKGTSFLLRTMGQERVVSAFSLSGLEVSSLGSNNYYTLPEVFTQTEMPVTVDNMIREEELAKWPHLSKVHIPHVKADVDLLIGTNAPKVLEPWEVINSSQNGPYATRTVLGWVVNGPLSGNSDVSLPSATVNHISLHKREDMLPGQYKHDFSEKASEEKDMSRDNIRFLKIMEDSAVLQEGRYCLKLPFKEKDVSLPNNLAVVKQRRKGLRRRFLSNDSLHQEYAQYVDGLISNAYAELVPEQTLQGQSGRVWYIPHHAGHHPRKRTLRVAFDRGATCQGASLNNMLLCQRRTKCRELTGPTPHSVAVRAKSPSSRPADQPILDRQKQEAFRNQVLDFTQNQLSCDVTTSWLQSSQRQFLRGAVDRRVQAALDQQEVQVEERRDRLRVLFETEEQQLQQEMEEMKEASLEKQAKMRERSKALREERASQRTEQQVCEERVAQVRSRQRQRGKQQLDDIRSQMEEAELTRRQQEVQRLQEQRERQQAQRNQRTRRRQLDQGLRLKMKRLSREQQDELQLDMSILQTLLQQEVDERPEAAGRKAERREEQQRYRLYLSEKLKKQEEGGGGDRATDGGSDGGFGSSWFLAPRQST